MGTATLTAPEQVTDTFPINGTDYEVVGTVSPTLTGNTADLYFPLASLQQLASKTGRVTQVLVKAKKLYPSHLELIKQRLELIKAAFGQSVTGIIALGMVVPLAAGYFDVSILAISTDPTQALKAWSEAQGFDFPLLSDFWPHGEVSRAYGVFDADKGCAVRGTFILDKEGVVRWKTVNGIPDKRDHAEYLKVLAEL